MNNDEQWLVNVDRTHLVLVSGKLALQTGFQLSYLRKGVIGLLDDLLPPLVLDVVDAELDLVKLSGRWEDAFEPLDLDGVGVLQARLLLHDGELLDLSAAKTKALDAVKI